MNSIPKWSAIPKKACKRKKKKETEMLEIDPNVDITFIIPGSVQYLYGRAAERNAGSRAHRVGTGQKEKQNPALRRAILGWGFRSLRWH